MSGPAACLRGDFGRITLREGANVQDTCVIHGFPDSDTILEPDRHVGHGAVIHGAHIGRNVLVGMNAVIMDRSDIGDSPLSARWLLCPKARSSRRDRWRSAFRPASSGS
jgi:phenylacetic acid degradation protein